MRKNTFRKLTALLLTLILVLSAVPITVSAAERQLAGNDNDGYYVNLPATGTDTLSLPDSGNGFTFKVYDSGGSGANYTNNCNSSLLITAPSGYILKVSGSGSCIPREHSDG